MTYDFFNKINNYNRELLEKNLFGVNILEYDETEDMLFVEVAGDRRPFVGKEFMQWVMESRFYYVLNPEVLENSSLVHGYHIKRKLDLIRNIERHYIYHEYYEEDNLHNEVSCNNTVLVIDYLSPFSAFRRYDIELGNLLITYINNQSDKDKTIKKAIKKIEKKMKKYKEVCFLTDKEKEWLEHALSEELDKCQQYMEKENE